MKLELQAELLRRYPKFFRKPGLRDYPGPFDEWSVECGDGWFSLIDHLCRACENEIEMLASRGVAEERWPRVAQIKEKTGSLRFYIRGRVSDELREKILRVEECECRRTCEQCGAPKKPWQIGSGHTLCDSCQAKSADNRTDHQTCLLEHARVLAMLEARVM